MESVRGDPVTPHPSSALSVVDGFEFSCSNMGSHCCFFSSLGGQVPELQGLYSTVCVCMYICVCVHMCVQVHMPIWKPEDISVFRYHSLS